MNEVVHDVLYTLHRKQTIPREALVSDFELMCRRVAVMLQRFLFGCFAGICGLALYAFASDVVARSTMVAAQYLFLALASTALLWTIVDALPTCRDLFRFELYAYQVRQLEVAHDLLHATDLERFGLPALNLTDRWLALRIERMKLRMGMLMGSSEKVAVLAVISGAWAIWHNFPSAASAFEQYLYLLFGAVVGGWGIGAMFVNVVIARLSYQRDLLALAICRHTALERHPDGDTPDPGRSH